MSSDTAELSASIKTTYAAFLEVSKRSIEHALTLGDLLNSAKEEVGHGSWLAWLARECPAISERHARNFMALARHRSLIESKSAIIADMTLSQALALIPRAVPVKLTKERPVVRSARDPGEPLLHRFTPEAEPDELAKPKSCRFLARLASIIERETPPPHEGRCTCAKCASRAASHFANLVVACQKVTDEARADDPEYLAFLGQSVTEKGIAKIEACRDALNKFLEAIRRDETAAWTTAPVCRPKRKTPSHVKFFQ